MWAFKKWYAEHKDELSASRKARYANDKVYRDTIRARAIARRSHIKDSRPKLPGINAWEVSAIVGVTYGTLGRWKRRGFLPIQILRLHRFTATQVELVGLFKKFFEQYPKRASEHQKDKLQDLINVVAHNWN